MTTAKVIKCETVDDRPDGTVAVLNLADLAADARGQADRIVAEARAAVDRELAAVRQRGHEEGLACGREEGYAVGERLGRTEASEEFRREFDGACELAGNVAREISASRDDLLNQAARQALDFALEVAAKIVGRVAVADPRSARRNLARVLEKAVGAAELTVRVNPGQLAMLGDCAGELADALGILGEVRLVADESIQPGGVKLLSRQGEIDATIATQLANVVRSLTGECGGDNPKAEGTDGDV